MPEFLNKAKHVAIIMDGNGRWAQRRHRPRIFGHIRGSSRVKAIVQEAVQLKIQALTLYAFSTENWARPEAELQILWRLLKKYLQKEQETLERYNVRFQVIGELERLGQDVQKVIRQVTDRLSKNTGLLLTFAVSYGARRELARAARLFAEDCLSGKRTPGQMDEKSFEDYLWTSSMGHLSDVDLVIRTSGEVRISNFLLWQAAYAEFVFADLCWPEFGPEEFRKALMEYSERNRRFGKVKSPSSWPGTYAAAESKIGNVMA